MRKNILLAGAALAVLIGFSGAAHAAPGFVSGNAKLRAGPGVQYPVIARISAGTRLNINGCVESWNWCDINTGNFRGWVAGRHLNTSYNNRHRAVVEVGSNIGLPFIVFNQDEYWGQHYRNQPFYRNYHPHNDRDADHWNDHREDNSRDRDSHDHDWSHDDGYHRDPYNR